MRTTPANFNSPSSSTGRQRWITGGRSHRKVPTSALYLPSLHEWNERAANFTELLIGVRFIRNFSEYMFLDNYRKMHI